MMKEPNKLPVIVITGFLGSGKTTLLDRLLADGVKTAVVINEFGSTPVDQDLLDRQDLPMTVLAGGCLCCQIKGALAPTLKNLWMAWRNAEPKPFERVIVETSGVASPEPILDTLLRERWIAERYYLRHILTTLAIPSAPDYLAQYPQVQAQVAWADSVWLTHDDMAGTRQTLALQQRLTSWLPSLPVRLARQLSTDEINGPATRQLRRLPAAQPAEHGFNSVSWYWPKPLHWAELRSLLQALLADPQVQLVRIKGVMPLHEFDSPQIIQAANGLLYPPSPLPADVRQNSMGRLVLIGRGDLLVIVKRLAENMNIAVDDKAITLH